MPTPIAGGRRIVRINDAIIAICPHGSSGERTYRSFNNGEIWVEIDVDGANSGCLISGPNQMAYHFYRYGDSIYMVKFKYNETPPSPVSIYQNADLLVTDTGAYKALNAIVDSTGNLYVATHWGSPDQLYLIRSFNGGATWDGPFEISSGNGPWFYPHLEVTSDDLLVCTYVHFETAQVVFAKSSNHGENWVRVLISNSNELSHNPSLLTIDDRHFFVFAQSGESAHRGLVYNYTVNQGATWNGWTLIDPTCGYADPSPGLGNDGQTIYVAYRSSNGTGVTTGTCGDQSRSRLAMSSDLGQTWDFVDNYYEGERAGTRSQIRYQTWWNYGGPLEWIWMQYEDGGANRPIYYDINVDESIKNIQNNPIGPVANFSGTPTSGTAPLEVSFADLSAGDVESWAWSFGDGGSSTNQNPTHTYEEFGHVYSFP